MIEFLDSNLHLLFHQSSVQYTLISLLPPLQAGKLFFQPGKLPVPFKAEHKLYQRLYES